MIVSALLLVSSAASAPFTVTLGQAHTLQGLRVVAVAPAPTGTKIAATLENLECRIIDAKTGMTIRKFSTPQPAYGVAWNPKGTQIVTGDESGRIIIWNAANAQKVKEMRPHTKGVQAVVFNTNGTRVMSTGKDDSVKIINIVNGKTEVNALGKGQNLYGAVFVPGGYAVGTLQYCPQIRKGVAVYKCKGHSDDSAFEMDYNPKVNRVLSAGRDGNAIVWSMVGAKLMSLKGHMDWVVHARFSPNGKYAVTSSTDRTVRLFNTATGACDATLQNESSVGAPVTFTSDGKYLITASSDDFLQIWPVNPPQGAGGKKK